MKRRANRRQRFAVRRLVIAYGQQEPPLQDCFDEAGILRFAAPLEEIRDGDLMRTWTSWAEEANPSLP